MKNLKAVYAFAAVLLLSHPALSQTTTVRPSGSKTHVYFLRGLLNVFSLGLDAVAAKLESRGIHATVHNHLEWLTLADEAIQACKSGSENQIILVGHSLGASGVVDMADHLSKAGVEASLIVSIDPVTRVAANGTVPRLINYYVSDGVGQPVAKGPNFHGVLQNVDLKGRPEAGHFITNSETFQEKVFNDVVAGVHSAHAGCRIGVAHTANRALPPGSTVQQ
jgi:hypothetical protein